MLSASQDALEVMLVTVSSNFTDATQVSEGTFLMWLWRLVILMEKTSDLTSGYLELPSGLVECPTQLIYIFFMLSRWWRLVASPICGSKKFEPPLRPGGSR